MVNAKLDWRYDRHLSRYLEGRNLTNKTYTGFIYVEISLVRRLGSRARSYLPGEAGGGGYEIRGYRPAAVKNYSFKLVDICPFDFAWERRFSTERSSMKKSSSLLHQPFMLNR